MKSTVAAESSLQSTDVFERGDSVTRFLLAGTCWARGYVDGASEQAWRLGEEGKNATVHIAHATIPYTEPNVSAALGNNTLIVALPNAAGDGSIPQHTSSAQQQYTVVIPDGLYDVEGLQRAVNMAVNGVACNQTVKSCTSQSDA